MEKIRETFLNKITKDLEIVPLFIVTPIEETFALDKNTTVVALKDIPKKVAELFYTHDD